MGVGRLFENESRRYVDRTSGREVRQLTDYLGHSYQFYFTHPSWLNDGRSLIFNSQRENRDDFFRCDIETGLITQLTDHRSRRGPGGCLSSITNRLYYWAKSTLHELDLATLEERTLCESPPTHKPGKPAASADGKHVFALLTEKCQAGDSHRRPARDGGSADLFERQPLTRIARIDVATATLEILFEDASYISHLNPSPARSDLLTFCHEGPWERVDQRIWGLNAHTREVSAIRPQNDDYSVVAEHWLADGEHIGFRSHRRGTDGTRFGHIRYDNENHVETDLSAYSRHFHSLDGSLVVGDGSPVYPLPAIVNHCETWPYTLLYPWTGQTYGNRAFWPHTGVPSTSTKRTATHTSPRTANTSSIRRTHPGMQTCISSTSETCQIYPS